MTNTVFKLEDSGFSREQVEALTEFMDGSIATKADIERLEGRLNLIQWIAGSSVAIGLANLYLILRLLQAT